MDGGINDRLLGRLAIQHYNNIVRRRIQHFTMLQILKTQTEAKVSTWVVVGETRLIVSRSGRVRGKLILCSVRIIRILAVVHGRAEGRICAAILS